MRVIADTSPLIALHRIDHLHLLNQLYKTVWIPPAVRRELLQGSQRVGWATPLREARWIRLARLPVPISSRLLRVELGAGESEALSLALHIKPSLLIIDDVAARRIAQALGLRYTGTLGVLLRAKSAKLIPAVHPLLERLTQHTFRISEALYHDTLSLAGE